MRRSLFAGVLFLSTMAACQSAMHAGIVLSDVDSSASPVVSCLGPGPTKAQSEQSVSPTAWLSANGCGPEDDLALEHNQTPVCRAATTASDIPSSDLSSSDLPSSYLPEAPVAVQGTRSGADNVSDIGARLVAPAPELGKSASKSGRTLDRKFILLHTLSTVALVADLETTARGFERQPNATELNPMFGAHPTRSRLYGIALPLDALSLYLSYHYKKIEPGRNGWKVGPGLSIAIHSAAVINNIIALHR